MKEGERERSLELMFIKHKIFSEDNLGPCVKTKAGRYV